MREDAMFPAWLGHVSWLVATMMTSCWLLGEHTMAASLVGRRKPPPDADSASGRRQLPVLTGSRRRLHNDSEDDLQMVDNTRRRPWQINRGFHYDVRMGLLTH